MSYAIVGFGKIGQALAHAFARKNIDVTVASRRPPEALAPQAERLDPRSSPSRCRMHSRPTQSSWRFRSGNIARLRRPCRVGKARRSSTRRTRLEFSLKSWTASVLRLRREGVHRRQVRERFQSPACGHPGYRSGRRGRPPGRLSVERRRGRDRSRGGFGQTTRVRTRRAGKAQRGWRAGACTRPHLGSAHLPGFVQEGAVIDDYVGFGGRA